MEFPLSGLSEMNRSEAGRSLYSQKPVFAAPYVGVLGIAAVVGTFGNLVVIITVTIKYVRSLLYRAQTAGNETGRAFTANLALSDMIVTALINPLAIAGICADYCRIIAHEYALICFDG